MDVEGRRIWVVRHGETEWSRLGRHTGHTDVPLTEAGREQARYLTRRLARRRFGLVLASPRTRARETASLAGYADTVVVEPDLQEWDYGAFEGRTSADIRSEIGDWTIWTGPWRGGETVDEIGVRADRLIDRCLDPAVDGDALLFAHGHLLRVVAARWLGLPAASGGRFRLGTGTVGILGWEHGRRAIETWNDAGHLEAMHPGADPQSRPYAVVVAGSAGVGKSTFAAALASHLGGAVLDLDALYAPVMPLLRADTDTAIRRAVLYEGLWGAAAPSLAAGVPVLLVAPWTTERRDPEAWAALAATLAAAGGTARLVWVGLDARTLLVRLRERGLDRDASKLASPAQWLEEARPDEPPAVDHIHVDAALPTDDEARRVAGLLLTPGDRPVSPA